MSDDGGLTEEQMDRVEEKRLAKIDAIAASREDTDDEDPNADEYDDEYDDDMQEEDEHGEVEEDNDDVDMDEEEDEEEEEEEEDEDNDMQDAEQTPHHAYDNMSDEEIFKIQNTELKATNPKLYARRKKLIREQKRRSVLDALSSQQIVQDHEYPHDRYASDSSDSDWEKDAVYIHPKLKARAAARVTIDAYLASQPNEMISEKPIKIAALVTAARLTLMKCALSNKPQSASIYTALNTVVGSLHTMGEIVRELISSNAVWQKVTKPTVIQGDQMLEYRNAYAAVVHSRGVTTPADWGLLGDVAEKELLHFIGPVNLDALKAAKSSTDVIALSQTIASRLGASSKGMTTPTIVTKKHSTSRIHALVDVLTFKLIIAEQTKLLEEVFIAFGEAPCPYVYTDANSSGTHITLWDALFYGYDRCMDKLDEYEERGKPTNKAVARVRSELTWMNEMQNSEYVYSDESDFASLYRMTFLYYGCLHRIKSTNGTKAPDWDASIEARILHIWSVTDQATKHDFSRYQENWLAAYNMFHEPRQSVAVVPIVIVAPKKKRAPAKRKASEIVSEPIVKISLDEDQDHALMMWLLCARLKQV